MRPVGREREGGRIDQQTVKRAANVKVYERDVIQDARRMDSWAPINSPPATIRIGAAMHAHETTEARQRTRLCGVTVDTHGTASFLVSAVRRVMPRSVASVQRELFRANWSRAQPQVTIRREQIGSVSASPGRARRARTQRRGMTMKNRAIVGLLLVCCAWSASAKRGAAWHYD